MSSVNFQTTARDAKDGEVEQRVSLSDVNSKLKAAVERSERSRYQDFGIHAASTDDAVRRNALPGKELSFSLRRKSLVPTKPSPPPTVTSVRPRPRSAVLPYAPSPRTHIKEKVTSNPPMSTAGIEATASSSRVNNTDPAAPLTVGQSEDKDTITRCESFSKTPVPPPRRKRGKQKSLRTVGVSLPVKPEAPPLVKQREKPPVVTPRNKSIVLEDERRISGEGCEDNRNIDPTSTGSSVSKSQMVGNSAKESVENDLRQESLPVVSETSDNNVSCQQQGKESTGDVLTTRSNSDETTSKDTVTTIDVLKSRPPIAPRPRKRTKLSTSTPLLHQAANGEEGVVLQKPIPEEMKTDGLQNDIASREIVLQKQDDAVSYANLSSLAPEKEDDSAEKKLPLQNQCDVVSYANLSSLAPEKEEDDSAEAKRVRRLTIHFEEKQLPIAVPNRGSRRNTLPANRAHKPPLPPKAPGLLARDKQRRPIPRPRSGVSFKRKGEEESQTNDSNKFGLLQCSPSKGLLRPSAKHLAVSSPSLPTVGDAGENTSADVDKTSSDTVPLPPRRKANSISPRHIYVPVKEPSSNKESHTSNEGFMNGVKTRSESNLLSLDSSPVKNSSSPPRPPRRSKSSSVSDILEVTECMSGKRGVAFAREPVKGLKSAVKGGSGVREGDRVLKQSEEDLLQGERLEPEGAESQPVMKSPFRKTADIAKRRAASVGDISLLGGVSPLQNQLHMGYPSDTSSYTSSEGRASVMSSDTASLLERARQLSRNKKWCDQPEVKESGLVPHLGKDQLLQQEAIFEIITSEATYHLNLTTLIDTFMDDPKMDPNATESDRALDRTQHSMIFSNVKEIRRVSARFLEEILGLLNEDDVFLRRIFPVLEDYAINRFVCYERYCASQSHRLKELRECTEKSENFQRQLKRLEEAANQTLQSLVTAPMQRITKLPLLMNEILKRTPHDDPSHSQIESTLRATEEIADLCNKGAGKIGDLLHLETIWKKLNFGNLKPYLILAPGRKLRKEGTVERLKMNRRKSRVTPDKVQNYMFVFNDLFMITTEERERHHVVDYCLLNGVTVEPILTNPSSPSTTTHTLDSSTLGEDAGYAMSGAEWTVAVAGEEHAFLVTLQESAPVISGKTSGGGGGSENSYIFVVRTEDEKTKWMDALKERGKEDIVHGPPKALAGRNLTIITKKRKREAPTTKRWWKQPHVEQSGIVKTLSQQELELQEAIFEVLTSEEEHLTAMETLVNHYMSDNGLDPKLPAEQRVLNAEEYNDIFRYVCDVHNISAGLMKTLRERQRECVVVDTICDILLLCVERRFQGYISYCTNLPNSLEQLDTSIEKNESFRGYIKQLEEDQRLLRSLLLAPMERVRRLPELMRSVLKRTSTGDLNYSLIETTIRALDKVERLCTSGQQKVEKIKELYSLERQLDFGNLKPFSLVSVGRSLLKKGSITKLKVTQWFGKTVKRRSNHLIILTDHLLITRKIENVYKVMDMAPLDRVIVELVEPHTLEHNTSLTGENSLAAARWAVSKAGENYAFLVTLPDVRRSYTFVATSEEDRLQWIGSLTVQNMMSFAEETDSTRLTWEYFYLKAARDYCPTASSTGDLEMKGGDVLRVYRANNEWCEGLRVRDLHWGRIPTQYLAHLPGGWDGGLGEGEEEGRGFLVEATHDFPGSESGELQLEKGDLVKVARQMSGWCEGKKLRGNQWGWFPNTYTRTLVTTGTTSHTTHITASTPPHDTHVTTSTPSHDTHIYSPLLPSSPIYY